MRDKVILGWTNKNNYSPKLIDEDWLISVFGFELFALTKQLVILTKLPTMDGVVLFDSITY